MIKPVEIVEAMRIALEARNYNDFVKCFAEDAVLELPFALPGSPSRFEGIHQIRARFGDTSQLHTINKLFDLHEVTAVQHQGLDPDVVTVELRITGKNIATDAIFEVSSSIAVIRFKNSQIVHYRDYPNTMGLAGVIGLLPQLAASLSK
ncbi:nuclear transport factor 2 family protein [Pedobacter miscanthi]|uniref:nuclear transport factor 2 family protein n=1 Tax=Pedobacter miscanthi TaxID=2259170 RepID=UPI002931A9FA|nr:nuclear transport factor 2 family protein [Pedobacter miscanthi]